MSSEVLHTLLLTNEPEIENLADLITQDSAYAVNIAVDGPDPTASVGATEWRYQLAIIDDLPISLKHGAQRQTSVELIRKIKTNHPETEIIFLTNQYGEHAQTALDAGAFRYLLKPINADELVRSLRQAAEYRQLKCEKQIFESLLKTSAALSRVRNQREVLQVILRGMRGAGFDRVRLYLLSKDRERLVGVAQVGMKEARFVGVEWPIADDIHMKRMITHPRPQVFSYAMGKPTHPEDRLDKEGLDEWLSVPLLLRGEVIGQMSADNKYSRRPIINLDLAPLALFADQAAAAIENARLFEESQQRADQLDTVRHTTLAISSTSAPSRVKLLETITEQAVKLLRAKSGGIYKYFPEREELEIIADHQRPEYLGKTLKKGEGMAGQLVESGAPFMIVEDYNKWRNQALIYAGNRHFGAVVEVPLRWQEQTIGVLYLDDEVGRIFTEEEARLLGLFAQQAAIAVANKYLIDRDEERLARLEKLSRYTTEIMRNLGVMSLPELLTLIARNATEIINAEGCAVLLVKREGILSMEASYGHREGGFTRGREFHIRTGPNVGLTSHIAHERELFNAHGKELTEHFAVRSGAPIHTPSGECHSLLAIPLMRREAHGENLVGLMRVDNKKGKDGLSHPALGFTKEDEWVLDIFAETIVAAIESAQRTEELGRQRREKDRLVASLPLATISVDRQGTVIAFNQQSEKIFGFMADEVLGTQVNWLYYDQEEARRINKLLRKEDGKLNNYETHIRNKAGQAMPIRLAATWLLDEEGRRIGSAGYFEDLRQLKEAQEQVGLLLEANNVIARAQSLAAGMRSLAELLGALFPGTFCHILLRAGDDQPLVVEAVYPDEQTTPRWNSGLGKQVAVADYECLGRVIMAGAPCVISYAEPESRLELENLSARLGFEQPVQELLLIPLKLGERGLGLLTLGAWPRGGQSQLTAKKVELVTAIAAQSTVQIDRLLLLASTERREQLLRALALASNHIRAHKGTDWLHNEIVRQAAQLAHCQAGGLWVNNAHLQQIELRATCGLFDAPIGSQVAHTESLPGLVAQTGETRFYREGDDVGPEARWGAAYGLQTIIGLPLRQASGEVEAVLVVGTDDGQRWFSVDDLEILERFAAQAAVILQTARLLGQEQQRLSQIATLYQINDYIQATKDQERMLHAVLTGVTAGFSLGFNRAILLLVDKAEECLRGAMGIGPMTQKEARQHWTLGWVDNFADYLKRAREQGLARTALFEKTRELRLPLTEDATDIFTQVVRQRRYERVPPEQFDRLHAAFAAQFEPTTPLVVAPLVAQGEVLGLLVVDNKFNQAPITDKDVDLLLAFVATAAIALDNLRLFEQTMSGREKLLTFYRVSSALDGRRDPDALLREIVAETSHAAGAMWVDVILIDKQGRVRKAPITVGETLCPLDIELDRPGRISQRVMQTGVAVTIADVRKDAEVNPAMRESASRAAICLPLSLVGRRIGVMWIHYDQPRQFPEFETSALQLYGNQAAMAYDTARRMRRLDSLRQAAEDLVAKTGADEVLRQILHSAKKVLHADAALLWVYDQERDSFILDRSVAQDIPAEIWDKFQARGPSKRGTAYAVMQQGRVLIGDIADPQQNQQLGEYTRQILSETGVRGFQGLALQSGAEKLGVLYALYRESVRFDDQDRKPALIFASHAALALKKAKLFEQVSKTKEAAEAVAKVTVLGDRQTTADAIVREVKQAVGCDAVLLFEFEEQTGKLILPPATAGVWEQENGLHAAPDRDYELVYRLMKEDAPRIVEQVSDDPDFTDRQFAREQQIASCAAAPLQAQEQRVGVLFVNYRHPHRFTADEVQTIQLFAHQAAVALRNGQLFGGRARKLREQETLAELSTILLKTVDLQETLDRAVALAARLLYTEFCNIVLPDRDGRLIFRAQVGWDPELVGRFELLPGKASQTGFTGEKQEHIVVDDYQAPREFDVPDIVNKHSIRSGLSVPMFREGKVVGAMLTHTRTPRHFSEEEVNLLKLVANQTAIALRSAERHEELRRRSAHLKAVHEASKVITASFGLERKQVLDRIIERAVEGISPKAVVGTIQLREEATNELVIESIYPVEAYSDLAKKIGNRWSLDQTQAKYGRIGIAGRTIKTGKSQLARDVRQDIDYLHFNDSTMSELSVPLLHEGKVLGALNLESDQIGGFDEQDQMALEALAEHAVIAIQNAIQYETLKQTKGLVGARTALAWMGMASSRHRHDIDTEAATIANHVTLIRRADKQAGPGEKLPSWVTKYLKQIEHTAQSIQEKPPTPPLSAKEGVADVNVYSLIRERLSQLKQVDAAYCSVRLKPKPDRASQPPPVARVSSDWLCWALDKLVDNAIKEVQHVPMRRRIITITVQPVGGEIEIKVADRGRGIPERVKDQLFKGKVEKPDENDGLGLGLLVTQAIVETYGGAINYNKSDNTGAEMVIRLPSKTQ